MIVQPQLVKVGGIFRGRVWEWLDRNGRRYLGDDPTGDRCVKHVLRSFSFHNMVPNAALTDVLSVYLGAGTQKVTWYMSLVDNSGFSAFAAADTLASHAGWTENTNWTGTPTRKTWSPAAAASQAISNTTAVTFAITTTVTIKGAFLCSVSTGTSGILFATGAFSSNQSLVNGQSLDVTYTCNASSS